MTANSSMIAIAVMPEKANRRKAGVIPTLALDRDGAVVHFHKSLHNRQAQAGAPRNRGYHQDSEMAMGRL